MSPAVPIFCRPEGAHRTTQSHMWLWKGAVRPESPRPPSKMRISQKSFLNLCFPSNLPWIEGHDCSLIIVIHVVDGYYVLWNNG